LLDFHISVPAVKASENLVKTSLQAQNHSKQQYIFCKATQLMTQ